MRNNNYKKHQYTRNEDRVDEQYLINYFNKNVLLNNNDNYDEYLDNIKRYAKHLKDNQFSTSMIRKVYSKVLRADNYNDLKKLRPQFAYVAGKNSKKAIINFMDLLDDLIKKIDDKEGVIKFKYFLEAVVAYMKYYGDDK